MIQIPDVLREIRAEELASRDSTPKNDTFSLCGEGFGISSVKGKKKFMEDSHKIASYSLESSKKAFFGVYDGHGGRKAADFVAENLHSHVFEMIKNCTGSNAKEEAIKAGYLKTDEEFLKQDSAGGACCVTAIIEGQDIVISNVGDCRAVLCRGGLAEALTTDHKPENEDERKRIEDEGGYVQLHHGAWRVQGTLSISRSIGDAHIKRWISAEPDTKILQLNQDMEFLVLASDGLWVKVGNQEAIDTVTNVLAGKTLVAKDFSKNVDADFLDVCVNGSPSSKIRRVSLVKKPKEAISSPRCNKTINRCKENGDEISTEIGSPSSNLRRVSLVKKHIEASPSTIKTINRCKENGSPSSNIRRISLVKKQKEACPSPRFKTINHCKENGDDSFENGSPPSKLRKVSMTRRISMKPESPAQENAGNKGDSSSGLLAACEELVNLAVSRGSMDDITVMIIDLEHFRCNNS